MGELLNAFRSRRVGTLIALGFASGLHEVLRPLAPGLHPNAPSREAYGQLYTAPPPYEA